MDREEIEVHMEFMLNQLIWDQIAIKTNEDGISCRNEAIDTLITRLEAMKKSTTRLQPSDAHR